MAKPKAPANTARARTRRPAGAPETTGEDLLRVLDRKHSERIVLESLNALTTRTARSDGARCKAFKALDLATQFSAAVAYLLDLRSATEIFDATTSIEEAGVSRRVFERWVSIVKAEYARRINQALADSHTSMDLAKLRGDLPALSAALWSLLVEGVVGFLDGVKYADLDNNTRHLLQRVAEGSTDMAKVQVEVERTRLQTAKLRAQVREAAKDKAGKRGELTLDEVGQLVDQALGLRGPEVAS